MNSNQSGANLNGDLTSRVRGKGPPHPLESTVWRDSARRFCVAVGVIVSVACASVVHGQFIPSVPPKPEPTPEWAPPPPPPPPPAPAQSEPASTPAPNQAQPPVPTPAVPPISLVERTADGRVRDVPGSAELEAIRRVSMEPDRRERVDGVLRERGEEFERLVAQHPGKALELAEVIAQMDGPNGAQMDLGTLVSLRDKSQAIMMRSTPSEDLMRRGVILNLHKSVIDKAVEEYDTLRREEWQKNSGDNVMGVVTLIARDKTARLAVEPLAALDRLLDKVAQDPKKAAELPGLSEQSRRELRERYPNVPARERRVFLKSMVDADRVTLLSAFAPATQTPSAPTAPEGPSSSKSGE